MTRNSIIHKYLGVILSFFIGNSIILGAMIYVSKDLEDRIAGLVNQTFSVVSFLEEIRFTGIRITATAHEIRLITHSHTSLAENYDNHDQEEEEQEEIEEAFNNLEKSFRDYDQYVKTYYQSEKHTFERASAVSRELVDETKLFLLSATHNNNSDFFVHKERYEEIEEKFILSLNDVIGYERSELKERIDILNASFSHTTNVILACFIILFSIILYSSFSISRNIINRLCALQSITQNVSSDKINASADEEGHDEVSSLAKSFNAMARRLNKMIDEQKQSKVKLEKTVQMRTVDLNTALEQANKANQVKTDFLSSMSHELRTPLNAIIGFSQLLLISKKKSLNEKQTTQVEHIKHAGDHLLHLINDVLDFAKIESHQTVFVLQHVYPRDVFKQCLELMKPLAKQNEITLQEKKESEHGIKVDRNRLKQICLNLLSNAIKYNVQGGTVTFGCNDRSDATVRIYVSDTGKGVPADKIKNLFIPFDRLGMENSSIEGSGIGLTITKKLVHQMGGEIGCDSIEGKGTTFWVDFPKYSKPEGN